ncbi:hypothetical protein ACHQM5_011122 [Ranunculus cassubicifolius]
MAFNFDDFYSKLSLLNTVEFHILCYLCFACYEFVDADNLNVDHENVTLNSDAKEKFSSLHEYIATTMD